MDFHSLARRELQALCKKNKIPANITNVAMADALKSLEIVEGIEEIMTEKHDVMNPLKESVHGVLMPPAPAGVASRRRRAKEDSTVQRVYSTRRSARLVEKSTKILKEVYDSEASKISKHESLTKIGCSDVKKNLKRGLDDMDEGSAVTGVDENTSSLDDPEECEYEVVSTKKQYAPIWEEIIHLESEKPELKMEATEEKSEEAELPTGEREDIPEEQSEEAELPTGERDDIDETGTGFEMDGDFDGVGIDIVGELDKEGTGTEPNEEKCDKAEDPSDGDMPLKLVIELKFDETGIVPDTEAELDVEKLDLDSNDEVTFNADEIEESYELIEFDVLGDEQTTEATLVGSPLIKEHILVDDTEFLVSLPQIPTSFGGSGLPLNSASKASKTRVIAVLSDNISSCGKLKLTPIKGRAKDNNPVSNLNNMSVRKLTKEKLTITNNPIKDDNGSEGRPALQALPENRAVDETCNN